MNYMPRREYWLYDSSILTKKYMICVINPATNRLNTIHFGANDYDDYTRTGNEERKRLYRLRHSKDKIMDLTKSGCWSWWLLWTCPTLEQAIEKMERHFDISIINNL